LAFQIDADVYWKVLRGQVNPDLCEHEFDLEKLISNNKLPIACVKIPSFVKNTPPGIFISNKKDILAAVAAGK
jgi:hypothetical protein